MVFALGLMPWVVSEEATVLSFLCLCFYENLTNSVFDVLEDLTSHCDIFISCEYVFFNNLNEIILFFFFHLPRKHNLTVVILFHEMLNNSDIVQ